MAVSVAFQSADDGAAKAARVGIIIPKGAVQHGGDRDIVWVVRHGRAERRAITVEHTSGDECLVSAGLNDQERVVINPPPGIAEGARVTEKIQTSPSRRSFVYRCDENFPARARGYPCAFRLDLEVKEGEFLALMGPSGSAKPPC